VSNAAVTTDKYAASSPAPGNAVITGTFTANLYWSNVSITVGNSTTNAYTNSTSFNLANSTVSLKIGLPTSDQFANGNYHLAANGSWMSTPYVSGVVPTSGLSAVNVDSWPLTSAGAAEYVVWAKSLAATGYTASKILAMHNGSAAMFTSYGEMNSGANVGSFGVTSNATHVSLTFTPAVATANVTYPRLMA